MSKPQPQQGRPSFFQNLLTMLLIYFVVIFGWNYFRGPEETRRPEEILQVLRSHNEKLLFASAQRDYTQYSKALDKQGLTNAQKNAKRLEASVLVADTYLKAGVHRKNATILNNGYFFINGLRKEFSHQESWSNLKVDVPDDPRFTWTEWTPSGVYDQTVAEAKVLNRSDLVWGMFPGYQLIDFLVKLTGSVPSFSYAFAAFLLAVLVRGILYPITEKQLKFSRQMGQLQPLAAEIREKFKHDQLQLQQKTMELYREYGINPMAGCIPGLMQMPLILFVYSCMLHYRFEFTNGIFLWINPATSRATNGFIAPNLGEMDYILLTLYGISMIATALIMPVTDPSNAKKSRMMGVGISLFFAIGMFFYPLPSAFVLYWTFTNILATTQSLISYRKPLPPLVKVNAPHGGVYPSGPFGNGKATNGNGEVKLNGQAKRTGKPVQHKPKKRK